MWFLTLNSRFLARDWFCLSLGNGETYPLSSDITHLTEWAPDSEKTPPGVRHCHCHYTQDEKTEARAEDICSIRRRAELNLITLCLPTKADSKEGSAIDTVRPAQNYDTEYHAVKLRNREGNSCAVSQQLGPEQAPFAGLGSKPCSTDTRILKSSSPRVIEILPSCRQMLWRLGRI